jgi:hypothetical protein
MDELEVLLKKIEGYRERLRDYMEDGTPDTHDQYMRLVGRSEGLKIIELDIKEMIERTVES